MSLTAAPSSKQTKELYDMTIYKCRECARGSNLLGIFECPGELSEATANALLRSSDPMLQMFGSMRGFTLGFPNEKNIADAEEFGKEIYNKFTIRQSQFAYWN
jgi:hypothetical protein